MSSASFDADVLIVGLGPVGAVMATLLARVGILVIAIERSENVYPLPRAAHVDHEIMRVFQKLGIDDAIRASVRPAPPYEFRSASGATLMRIDPVPTGSVSGWAQSYMIHQPGIERALRQALVGAGVDVRFGDPVSSVSQDRDSVTLGLDSGDTIRARYVIGCDGASSSVRELLGVPLEDLQFDEPWLVIDALVDAPELLPLVNLQLCDPARPTTCVHMPAGRHRWEFMLLPGEEPAAMLEDAVIERLLASWGVAGRVGIERRAVYRFHGVLAERWRVDRVLLAGDAAHQMPPFAGQGLCSGLRDAVNLAWKIAAVLTGVAELAILDSYQSEREPHVRGYVEMAIGMGRMVCTLDPVSAAARDATMLARHAKDGPPPGPPMPAMGAGMFLATSSGAGKLFPQPWAGEGTALLRLDDVLSEGAWLIMRGVCHVPLPPMVHPHDLDGLELAPFRAAIISWLADHDAAAVLVRPDRYVFGTGEAAMLTEAFSRALLRAGLERSPVAGERLDTVPDKARDHGLATPTRSA